MKFYGNGVVWDAANNRRLCRFSRAAEPKGKGTLETDDPRICAELVRLGYKSDGVQAVPIPNATPDTLAVTPILAAEPNAVVVVSLSAKPVTAGLGVKELREIGKELGLTFPIGTTKVDMAKAINEAKK